MANGGIIVEGPENCGKSTFCKKLQPLTGLDYIHMTRDYGFKDGKFDYIEGYFLDMQGSSNGVIFDRYYLSELVYGKLRNICNISKRAQELIELRLNDLKYFLVLLDTDAIRWKEDREHDISFDENLNVRKSFLEAYKSVSLIKMIVDPTLPDSVDRVYEVWKQLNK
jgi:thymidylate kinase